MLKKKQNKTGQLLWGEKKKQNLYPTHDNPKLYCQHFKITPLHHGRGKHSWNADGKDEITP